jgi:uncharacterized repeat protein (TIGR03943 family)
MKKIGGVLEGLILLVIGGYAGLLVLFGDYWRFLNPKFKWLTAATAVVLIVVGVMAALHPNKRPRLSRIIIFLLLLRVFSIANAGISPLGRGAHGRGDESADEVTPRVTINGAEYVRINLAELYSLCQKAEHEKLALRYAVRGIVKRNEQLDRLGQFALIRNMIYCCLADSMGIGFRVKYGHVNELADGQWVEVYGTVNSVSQKLPNPVLHIKGMIVTLLSDSHILVPDKVAATKEPEIPYILRIRRTEPYAY